MKYLFLLACCFMLQSTPDDHPYAEFKNPKEKDTLFRRILCCRQKEEIPQQPTARYNRLSTSEINPTINPTAAKSMGIAATNKKEQDIENIASGRRKSPPINIPQAHTDNVAHKQNPLAPSSQQGPGPFGSTLSALAWTIAESQR